MTAANLLELPLLSGRAAQPHRLDPRTSLLLLLTINIVVLGNSPLIAVSAGAVVVTILLATVRPWQQVLVFVGLVIGLHALYLGLPRIWAGTIPATLATIGYWFARFSVSMGAAVFVLSSVKPGALVAALRQLRVPSVIVIPITVMLRFIPIVLSEARAVLDAMRLRGLEPGGWALLKNPLKTLEMVIVPLLSSVTRIADDLTASGLVRGLGGPTRPTSLAKLSFSWFDAFALMLAVGLVLVIGWPR